MKILKMHLNIRRQMRDLLYYVLCMSTSKVLNIDTFDIVFKILAPILLDPCQTLVVKSTEDQV